MTTKVTPLLPVYVQEMCDSCGDGEMITASTEKGLSMYHHACNKCGQDGFFNKAYPYHTSVDFFGFLSDSKQVITDLKAVQDGIEK